MNGSPLHRLNWAELANVCAGPASHLAMAGAVQALGRLAGWWLIDGHRAAVDADPTLKDYATPQTEALGEHGSCLVLLAPLLPEEEWPALLRRGFGLPLRWYTGRDDDPSLPASLRELATLVRRQLGVASDDRWGLGLHECLGPVDLSGLPIGPDSAWAAVSAGLALAREGLLPDRTVMATAAWSDEYGVVAVEDVDLKAAYAERLGARVLYIPSGQTTEAAVGLRSHSGTSFLRPLGAEGRSVKDAPTAEPVLRPLLAELGVKPGANTDIDTRRNYYDRLSGAGAEEFYRDRLLGDLARQCRQRLENSYGTWCPKTLVTVAAPNMNLLNLTVATLRPERCVLFHADDSGPTAIASNAQNLLGAGLPECPSVPAQLIPIRYAEVPIRELSTLFRASFDELVAAGLTPEETAVDMTAGFLSMRLALQEAAPPSAWLVYCRHDYSGSRTVSVGSEVFERWQKPAAAAG